MLLSLWLAAFAGSAGAQSPQPLSGHVSAELLAQSTGLVPGQQTLVGLRLRHEPHWHTYWINPGDAGLPTQLTWDLPPGYQAGPIQWPAPQRLMAGTLANYGYEGTVLLPVALSVPSSAAVGGKAHLAAHAQWLVCNDICLPEAADLTLELPVVQGAQAAPGTHRDEFAAALARMPRAAALKQIQAVTDGSRIRLSFAPGAKVERLEFFPLEGGRIQAAAPQRLQTGDAEAALDLVAVQPAPKDFHALRGVLVANGGADAAPGSDGWAVALDVPMRSGVLPPAAPVAQAAPPAAVTPAVAPAPPAAAPMTLGWALLGAFLGGIVLNLMPCVFPVLSLKLLGLVQHRQRGDPSLVAHGLSFAAGAIGSFVLLAGVLIALRAGGAQAGLGFQLQSPLFVALLTALFFGIGLNLLGAFEISFGTSLVNSKAVQRLDDHHLTGSLATGVLAVVVASPCTAPYMGAAIGFAATQPAAVAVAVFATLGAGMAAPYLALTLSPPLLRRLPRPGAWMERLRQLMAFPMFATCVWLLWVLAQQIDVNTLAVVLGALVALGLAAWALGQAQRGAGGFKWLGGAAGALAALVLVAALPRAGAPAARTAADAHDSELWAEWSPQALNDALAAGRPVFVDFTAAWCITCQANKQLVLYSRPVAQAFGEQHAVLLRADWTNRNESITRELARFGRNGVPLYVLYDRGGRSRVLPEILTQGVVLEALAH